MNVTCVPEQILSADEVITTEGLITKFTFATIVLLLTVLFDRQEIFDADVSVHITASLFFRTDEVKTGLFVPAFIPFTVH